MKKLVIVLFVVLGVLALLAFVAFLGIALVQAASTPSVSSSTVLEMDFEQGLVAAVPDDPIAQLMMEQATTLRDVVDALDKGATDPKVKAFVARIGSGGLGMANIQEIRDAVLRFRAAGKPAIAFAETFGEFGPGNGGYYLATAFDEIHLQPSGDIGLTGIGYESMFLAGTFEKLDIQPRMGQRHEFKNAMNMYTETSFTPAHELAMRELMDSQFAQMVRGIAESRGKTEEEVRGLIDAGPYLGAEALEAGLVDALGYRDEVYGAVLDQAGSRAKLLYLKKYLERAGRPNDDGTKVALVHGLGAVTRGRSRYAALTGQTTMGSDTVARALRDAIDDDDVEAIVFRVDSPGGSYVASDTILRELRRAQDEGKPVVVTMGNLAASGGYFVATYADRIVAQPGTITGSIGVLGGKLVTRGFWNKLGVTYDAVYSSEHADIYSTLQDYDPGERARLEAGLDRIYEDFTAKVAEGRELPLERVLEIAKGRIWTGEAALELGLVDALGGYETALVQTRELLELAPDAELDVRTFPRPRSPFQALFGEGRTAAPGRRPSR